MGWKELARDYLSYSRKERIAIIAIILLIFFIWLSPKILRNSKPKQTAIDTGWISLTQKLQSKPTEMNKNDENQDENSNALAFERSVDSKGTKAELFYFDPNKIAVEDWKRLGIREKTIHTIQNYLNKGGHFYKPSDLQRIYGLRPEEFSRLEPYVKIEVKTGEKQFAANPNPAFKKIERATPSSKPKTIDINLSDTTAFISLPGIGSKLSARIVNFRDRLGGFYSIDQVGEIYGLADTTFQKIKKYLSLANAEVKKFNINSVTKDELKSHPYFKWALANAIVEYRNQHGNFSSLEDLKKISLVTDEVYNKIIHYLVL